MSNAPFVKTLALVSALVIAGCSGGGSLPVGMDSRQASGPASPSVTKYIKHVVIIVQENRSFDNIFAGFKGTDYALSAPMTANGSTKTIALTPITFHNCYDVSHNWIDAIHGYDGGKMDGFGIPLLDATSDKTCQTNVNQPAGAMAYTYLEHSETKPYWAMAQQYALADHMFTTMFGPSFTAHVDLVASTANLSAGTSLFNLPNGNLWGCDAESGTETSTIDLVSSGLKYNYEKGPFPCFTQFQTIADRLDTAGLSWKYYAPLIYGGDTGQLWSIFDAVKSVACTNYVAHANRTRVATCTRGKDWNYSVESATPPSKVLSDITRSALPAVSWVIPDYADSDHAAAQSDAGPSWVASVVNAIGKSPYWQSTAIVVVWDDWGGWYDNVKPPSGSGSATIFRSIGLGERVPCIVISPYAKVGYVSHTQYQFGSIVKLIEQVFDLQPLWPQSLGYTDATSATMLDLFNFRQKARTFKAIPAKYPASHFLRETPSLRAPDDD